MNDKRLDDPFFLESWNYPLIFDTSKSILFGVGQLSTLTRAPAQRVCLNENSVKEEEQVTYQGQ